MHTTPLITNTPGPSSVRADSAYRGPCRVCGAHITRVTRGGTEEILCDEYDPTGGICLLRQATLGKGPSQGRTRCVMLTP
jgi:hypothetical protein